ncbi:MAG: SPASM domain-containing protein [Candidatus Bipolaricaulia bacterium]
MKAHHFFLNRECILVRGRTGSAIYNLFTGEMIALNSEIAMVLRLAEKGLRVNEIADSLSKDTNSVEEVLNRVAARDMGRFYSKRIYVEKYKKGHSLTGRFFMDPPVISKCYIELPGACDLACSFCESPKIYPCTMCSKNSTKFNEGFLRAFLKRLFSMRCVSLVFHGGDPIANQDKLLSITEFCRAEGFNGEIFVITNGTHIDHAVIKWLARYKIHPVIPFMGERNGSLIAQEKLAHLAQAFHQKGVEFTLTLVIDNANATEVQRIEDFAKNLGARSILRTAILDNDEGKLTEGVRALGRQMVRTTADVFYHNTEYHPCLGQTLAVSADGNLLPCPFLKDEVLGNIADSHVIGEIFESRTVDEYWCLNLSQIERCKDCALRYGCLDCRVVEKRLSGDLYGKILCSYNFR